MHAKINSSSKINNIYGLTKIEVIFSYKGRLYFRNTKDQRVEILAVGTKNTQARELEFLAKL